MYTRFHVPLKSLVNKNLSRQVRQLQHKYFTTASFIYDDFIYIRLRGFPQLYAKEAQEFIGVEPSCETRDVVVVVNLRRSIVD